YLYACFVLAIKYLDGPGRSWLMYFCLSPMVLVYSTYLGTDVSNLGVLLLSYLCFANYLETGRMRWMIWAGGLYLVAFWTSYIAFSAIPPILVQLLLHRRLSAVDKRRAVLAWTVTIVLGFAVVGIHLLLLPGALQWALGRAVARSATSVEAGSETAPISLASFAIRQTVRMVTHYTPVCVVLAPIAAALALHSGLRRHNSADAANERVGPLAVAAQFLAWGIPFGILAMNLAYIHPFSIYYFAVFFAFGSTLTLQFAARRVVAAGQRRILVISTIGLFLVFSLTRSFYSIAGGALDSTTAKYLPGFVSAVFAVKDPGAVKDGAIPRDQW